MGIRSLEVQLYIGKHLIDINTQGSSFNLLNIQGTGASTYDIGTINNAQSDGSSITYTRIQGRIVTITFEISDYNNAESIRQDILRYFSPYEEVTLYIKRNGIKRRIYGRLLAVNGLDNDNLYEYITPEIDILCPDPYFLDGDDNVVDFFQYIPLITFPLTFLPYGAGLTTGLEVVSHSTTINNNGDASVGVWITVDAVGGDVINPKIICNDEFVQIETTLHEGDILEISTLPGEKNVYINGEKINLYAVDSTFFALPLGENTIEVEADEETVTNAHISVTYARKYYGV